MTYAYIMYTLGVYTGSIYRDYALLKNGFPGESVANGSVLIVKEGRHFTNQPRSKQNLSFSCNYMHIYISNLQGANWN